MSAYEKLFDFDKDVKAQDKEIYDWQSVKYAPLGLANTKPTSEAIANDLNFYRGWKVFFDKWNKDKAKLVEELSNSIFETKDHPAIDDDIKALINKRKEELALWASRFSIVKSGKKDPLQVDEPVDSNFGTLLFIGAVSAGIIWVISKVSK